jgi:hypothetical protein
MLTKQTTPAQADNIHFAAALLETIKVGTLQLTPMLLT